MTDIYKKDLLKGKTAFVAGGSSGINLGIAERYAELGANIVILSRSQDKIDVAVKGIEKIGAKALGFIVLFPAQPAISFPLLSACHQKAFKPSLILTLSEHLMSSAQAGISWRSQAHH